MDRTGFKRPLFIINISKLSARWFLLTHDWPCVLSTDRLFLRQCENTCLDWDRFCFKTQFPKIPMCHTCGLGFIYSHCNVKYLSLGVLACVCGEKEVILYLSLIHGVVTYVDDWSGVSLGGPYGRDKGRDRHCTQPPWQRHTCRSLWWCMERGWLVSLNLWKWSAREDRAANHSEGSKRLFKDISSLKVVMDGSVRARAVPIGYVYVRVCAHVHFACQPRRRRKMLGCPPPAPPPVCALPSRQPYVKCPLRVPAHVATEFT